MENDPYSLELDSTAYSISAVRRAAYDLAEKATVVISQKGRHIKVELSKFSRDKKQIFPWDIFIEATLDHQLRIDTEQEFRIIRNIIVAQAMEPRQDIGEVVRNMTDHASD